MAKLPSSFRERNHTTRRFREQYAELPAHIRQLAKDGCRLFDLDPRHPSFRWHRLGNRKQASHSPGSVSISITMKYRAIFVERERVNVWYWIGTHAEYDTFTAG